MTGSRFVLAAALMALLSLPAYAQEGPQNELRGEIVAADSGRPIAGAWIALADEDWGAYSWNDGHFRLPEIPARPSAYDVEALGYISLTTELDPSAGPVSVALSPDPSVMPGLSFLLARLENRRNAGRHLDREQLAYSGYDRLADLLRARGIRANSGRDGRACLNERPIPFESVLSAEPGDFYLVEQSVGRLRLYTQEYLDRLARQPIDEIESAIRMRIPIC